MSLDRSLKTSGNLVSHRNVLTRAERIARLQQLGKYDPQKQPALHLPKTANRKVTVGRK